MVPHVPSGHPETMKSPCAAGSGPRFTFGAMAAMDFSIRSDPNL